ncbi:leucine-zipper of insertion element IS481 [Streptomyces sp. WMMB 714]|nr:leucine-zipper of insertion element IS481 [Streptomyces sp. WMMB 714]
MTHPNAPFSYEGRRRLVHRCQRRPIAHVAAEMGISRACASKWVNRWRAGLIDRPGDASTSGRPNASPTSSPNGTKPYTPQHNGKVERHQRIFAEELLYAREFTGEDARSAAIAVWNIHYDYHRPYSGAGGRPPATRLRQGVTNVRPSYT